MYSGYGGIPSRTLSTMSLSVHPIRHFTSRSITRSQSFAGVKTNDKASRNRSVFSTPGLSRKPTRASKIFTMSSKCNPPPKVPQPERLDQVYNALKKGLQSYLQVQQMDLDNLSCQLKESKRNSRLGLLYEVDKQVKVKERYIRRLEFHLSKIEELYEAYSLQRRLREGAEKMMKAYMKSPGSKEARDSLAEVNKEHKEYTENMCVLESKFESHLGGFHIKMKGLAGFARLCAGDHYEILMRYGRQRWRLRGKMEMNAKQAWDNEEMFFFPLINDFLSVKVTELKSVANHMVVGSVSCETKDLFTALPQTVAVDINDLGTVKLSLEVTWHPFDKEEHGSNFTSVNKSSSVSKRLSTIFNQSPPGTPSLREQAFFTFVQKKEHQPATMGSCSPKLDIPHSPLASGGKLDLSYEAPNIPKLQSQLSSETSTDGKVMNQQSPWESVEVMSPVEVMMELPSRVTISEFEPGVRKEEATPVDPNTHSPMDRQQDLYSHGSDRTYIAHLVSVEEVASGGGDHLSPTHDSVTDNGLENILASVVSSLEDYRGQFPELQLLEQEVKMLQVTLKGGGRNCSPSMVSVMVETALGSFDFLNTVDWEDAEKSEKSRTSERSLQDRGWDIPSSPPAHLTTGCSTLDFALEIHLTNCSTHLLRLGMFGPLRCGEMYALDKLLREVHVLEIIRCLTKNDLHSPRHPVEVVPQLAVCEGAVSLWQHCVGQDSIYIVSGDKFLNSLSSVFSRELPESSVTVFMCLLERVLDHKLPQQPSGDSVTVTVFQLWIYLESNNIIDLETHINELTQEVWFVNSLASCDQEVILHTLQSPQECILKRDGLPAVVRLLKDPRTVVSASASSVMKKLAAHPRKRKQALVRCLELLEDDDVYARVCGCKALACLKAKESIDQLVYLCQTDNEEVQDAAKQTLLLLGEEGKMAHRHVETSKDTLPRLFTTWSMTSTAF